MRVSSLDELTREAMWQLYERYYLDVDRRRFQEDLSAKTDVILVRDADDGSIRGFGTLLVRTLTADGRTVRILYTGDTVLDRPYWGSSVIQRQFLAYAAKLWLRAPHQPLYWFLISKGFRTYLLLARNLPNSWPHPDRPTPAREMTLLNAAGRAFFGSDYREAEGVVRFDRPQARLREDVAPIDERALAARDIQFFVEKNPGHTRGDELCCLGLIDLEMVWFNVRKYVFGRRREARR